MGTLRITEIKRSTAIAKTRKIDWPKALLVLGLSILGLLFLYPFIWMLSTSVKDNVEVFTHTLDLLPQKWKFENYITAFTLVPFARFYLNTIIMTAGRVVGQVVLAAMAAYSFARLRFPAKDTLFLLVLAVMMVPSMVTFLPKFLLIMRIGWLDTYWGLIVPGLADAFGVFLLRQFFMTIPQDFLDAAEMDGCNPLETFLLVALPLARSAMAAYAFLVVLWTWNDFLWPLIVVNSTKMLTLSLGIQLFQSQYTQNTSVMMAAASISILPMLILFLFAQRFIIEGITMSGLKF
jgi:multiple sugar transport system permease protein